MQIQIKHIKKVFKDKEVLNDISFTIESGSICGLLGVNGAGKSTLMKTLYGLESQSAGEILFDGKTSKEIKDDKKFGALIESPAIYMNLSAFDNLKTKALLYDIPDETIRETLNLIGLANTGRKKAGKFSLGMKQRLGLGMAIITNPEFLILDEPTNGLDPDGPDSPDPPPKAFFIKKAKPLGFVLLICKAAFFLFEDRPHDGVQLT